MQKIMLKSLSVLRDNQGIVALALTFIAIIVAVITVGISIQQLQRAERASELNSVSTILSVYNSPKSRYYDAVAAYTDRCEVSDEDQQSMDNVSTCGNMFLFVTMSLWDYVNAIEAACNIYQNDLLDPQRKQFISTYVTVDIQILTFNAYDEESGEVGVNFFYAEPIKVPWIKRNLEPSDEQYPFEATRACLDEWEIELESFSLGVG